MVYGCRKTSWGDVVERIESGVGRRTVFGCAEGYTRRGAASRQELNYDPEL